MERRQCYVGGADPAAYAFCQQGRIRRTVWEGARELWEIQMPARPQDSLLLENDVAAVPYWAGAQWDNLWADPNPLFGRLAYLYAGGVDQPLSVTRLNLVRKRNQSEGYTYWNPVAVAPHWNWRGAADFGTFLDGGAKTCTDASHCVLVKWLVPAFAVGVTSEMMTWYDGTPFGWFGTLINDKQDATGTHYRRNRYVDPVTGRFTQEDPIGLAGGLNLYGFASGDPVNFADPFGLDPCRTDDFRCQLRRASYQALAGVLGSAAGWGAGTAMCGPAAPVCAVSVAPALALATGAASVAAAGAAFDVSNQNAMANAGHGRGSNRAPNAEFDRAVREAGLNREGRDALHRDITGQGHTFDEILEMARKLAEQAKYRVTPPSAQ
jgi:RHS repeat-associated protein